MMSAGTALSAFAAVFSIPLGYPIDRPGRILCRRRLRAFALIAMVAFTVAGGSARILAAAEADLSGLDPFAFFDSSTAPTPEAGQWLEYRVAYPIDPLENSLADKPVPPPRGDALLSDNAVTKDEDYFFFKPHFNAPTAWKSLPIRLEIHSREGTVLKIAVTYAGQTHLLDLDLNRPEAAPESARDEFHWDPPQPEPAALAVSIGGTAYEAGEVRRIGSYHGFVRRTSLQVPFGLIRFATENIDMALVGIGSGPPPAFPLPESEVTVEPPLGGLYQAER